MTSEQVANEVERLVAEFNGDYRKAFRWVEAEHGSSSELGRILIDAITHDMPEWQRNFSSERFPVEEMPEVPDIWEDASWHDDVCPCFIALQKAEDDTIAQFDAMVVWIAEKEPSARELPIKRYAVSYQKHAGFGGPENIHALETDNWQEVLDYVNVRVDLANQCLNELGHNPFLKNPHAAPEDVRKELEEHTQAASNNPKP